MDCDPQILGYSPGSLFDKLPNELLTYILRYSTPSTPHIYNDPLPRGFLLVNKRWHANARNTAQLWASFQFSFLENTHIRLPAAVSTWITRSHPRPLVIGGTMGQDTDIGDNSLPNKSPEYQAFKQVVQTICDASSRWDHITLFLPYDLVRYILKHASEHAPSRSQLYITMENDEDGTEIEGRAIKVHVPNVAVLHLDGVVAIVSKNTSHRRREHIRTVHIDSVDDVDVCISIAQSAPNLESLFVVFYGRWMTYDGPPILVPQLHSVHFAFKFRAEEDDVEGAEIPQMDVFQKITVPGLVTLCLSEEPYVPYTHLPSIPEFITRSGCALARFSYYGQMYDEEKLRFIGQICQLTPSLKALDVRGAPSLEFLTILLRDLDEAHSVPHLMEFAFELPQPWRDKVNTQSLRSFAERRSWKNGGTLRTVAIVVSNAIFRPKDHVVLLNGLQDFGVEFSFRTVSSGNSVRVWDQ